MNDPIQTRDNLEIERYRLSGDRKQNKKPMLLTALQKAFKQEQRQELAWEGPCHDCGEQVTVVAHVAEDGELTITGGAVYHPELTRRAFVKCDACFEKDKTLRNYQACEVYSRIVGYLRPTSQWNPGKKAEFGMRKMFGVGERKADP